MKTTYMKCRTLTDEQLAAWMPSELEAAIAAGDLPQAARAAAARGRAEGMTPFGPADGLRLKVAELATIGPQ